MRILFLFTVNTFLFLFFNSCLHLLNRFMIHYSTLFQVLSGDMWSPTGKARAPD